LVNGTWGQTESSESQITVLKIPNDSEDTSVMEEVGSVDGIGVDERIYAARFFGDKAYVVTFRTIDPFYTVDMSIPDDPKVVGELKIPGFSVSCRCAVIFEPHSVYEATTVFNELFFLSLRFW